MDDLVAWKGIFFCASMSRLAYKPWQQFLCRKPRRWAILEKYKRCRLPLCSLVTKQLYLQMNRGARKGIRKPRNRTETRQKTANRIRFFPEYRDRTYMEAHYINKNLFFFLPLPLLLRRGLLRPLRFQLRPRRPQLPLCIESKQREHEAGGVPANIRHRISRHESTRHWPKRLNTLSINWKRP